MADRPLVHLASPPVRAGNVVRQRCGWCGALIDELDLERVAVPIGDEPLLNEHGLPRLRWEGLVAVARSGGRTMKHAVPDPEDGRVPEDSCMALADEVTQ